ncbi:hypothetical protein J8273_6879 [Carpediemonas membranifera]|uniref:Uncharacterized protein n=1 Tax=Carpediemonas membranifera TaxID=201153 RepID=A0A8J6BVX7_9EUKA|nr:hypothetical protein J8273_6879 [Carpediemonas membranifera]|eukprot:KAG9391866.1 hypothetical protein J8273_6879 [Carpediemonas membranifera]
MDKRKRSAVNHILLCTKATDEAKTDAEANKVPQSKKSTTTSTRKRKADPIPPQTDITNTLVRLADSIGIKYDALVESEHFNSFISSLNPSFSDTLQKHARHESLGDTVSDPLSTLESITPRADILIPPHDLPPPAAQQSTELCGTLKLTMGESSEITGVLSCPGVEERKVLPSVPRAPQDAADLVRHFIATSPQYTVLSVCTAVPGFDQMPSITPTHPTDATYPIKVYTCGLRILETIAATVTNLPVVREIMARRDRRSLQMQALSPMALGLGGPELDLTSDWRAAQKAVLEESASIQADESTALWRSAANEDWNTLRPLETFFTALSTSFDVLHSRAVSLSELYVLMRELEVSNHTFADPNSTLQRDLFDIVDSSFSNNGWVGGMAACYMLDPEQFNDRTTMPEAHQEAARRTIREIIRLFVTQSVADIDVVETRLYDELSAVRGTTFASNQTALEAYSRMETSYPVLMRVAFVLFQMEPTARSSVMTLVPGLADITG